MGGHLQQGVLPTAQGTDRSLLIPLPWPRGPVKPDSCPRPERRGSVTSLRDEETEAWRGGPCPRPPSTSRGSSKLCGRSQHSSVRGFHALSARGHERWCGRRACSEQVLCQGVQPPPTELMGGSCLRNGGLEMRHLSRPSVQLSSVTQLCPTLSDPMGCSTPGLSVHHHPPEFTQTRVH